MNICYLIQIDDVDIKYAKNEANIKCIQWAYTYILNKDLDLLTS